MIVIRTTTHVADLTGAEITAFLLHPSDRSTTLVGGNALGISPGQGRPPNRRHTWLNSSAGDVSGSPACSLKPYLGGSSHGNSRSSSRFPRGSRSSWKTTTEGFEGIGRMLDPVFRVHLSEKFPARWTIT